MQGFRFLVAHEGLILVLIGVADDDLIGIDHAETPGFDVLFLTQCQQDVEELLIGFEHFHKFHDATIGDIQFAVEAIGTRIAFDANFTDS